MKTAKALDLIVPPSLLVREEPRRTGTIRLDLRCSIAVAVAMFVLPVNAQRVEIGPGGVRFGEGRPDKQVCAQLRRACLHKDELGEQGAAIVGRVDDVDSRHGQEPACLSPKSSIGNADARRSQSVPQLKEAGPPCRRFVFLAMPRSL